MADTIYNRFIANLLNKQIDFEADAIRGALLQSAYTIDKDHKTWSDLSAYEASGTGYTTKGKLLSNVSVTENDTSDLASVDADDLEWTSATITARYLVLVDWEGGLSDLICVFDFGEDKSASGSTFTAQVNAGGLLFGDQG